MLLRAIAVDEYSARIILSWARCDAWLFSCVSCTKAFSSLDPPNPTGLRFIGTGLSIYWRRTAPSDDPGEGGAVVSEF